MDVVQTPNTMDAFFARVLFWFHNRQAQKVLTVEVHNPASLLVDLTPLTPTLNIGKPGTHRNEKLKHNLCRLLPNIKCGGYGGERHRKTMQDLVLQQ